MQNDHIAQTVTASPSEQSSSPVARLDSVSKQYGSVPVLQEVSVDVKRGEKIAIIGPSGSGKTTILRVLMGLVRPDAGTVIVNGVDMWAMQRRGRRVPARERHLRKARRPIGMVFQHYNLFPHLTAMQNVCEGLTHIRGLDKEQARTEATELLGMVGLETHAEKKPAQLSGGQQQRVAIARAVALRPQVMLFDEVTSALDPELVGEVLRAIRMLAERSEMALLLVTHEMAFAERISDRVVVFDHGQIVEQGPPDQIFHAPAELRTQQFLRSLDDRG